MTDNSMAIAMMLKQQRRRSLAAMLPAAVVSLGILWAFAYGGAFDLKRYHDALPTILTLASDALPPDFSRWSHWGKPLLETLAMSIAGTVLAALAALPLGVMAAGSVSPPGLRRAVQMLLNVIRSIPDLVWGVMFVAAVGFGPLPGILALAFHSLGMLGKFYAEIVEHMDPAPALALKGQGVAPLGVIRFAVWPQILPRLADVTLYRWEHNLRAATVLGVIGAGGLGLELITAFHLFEYRESLALIIVILGLVTVVHAISAGLRRKLS
ncbi:MAG TPA: phosphonate ABC transporter, permease protein PhnE [Candidatus Sulfotelmatobacter sp.]|jgi:phosphonate transport system permease protein|nr:phosphonate ABC transporter, permease protein PhnE [Candidatus Sulfotelmatobacter sp.]